MSSFRGSVFAGLFGIGLVVALVANPAFAIQIDAANAPADNLALTLAAIQSAQSSILLNIYELDAPQITDALVERIQAGVSVRILEEGQPVGGLSTAAKGAQYQLQQAMQAKRVASQAKGVAPDDALFVMTSKAGGKRRYRYDHAKYAVIDGKSLLIGSENYSPTGNPTAGSVGNRGWEVVIHDAGIAQQFATIFAGDAVTTDGDVIALVGGDPVSRADSVSYDEFLKKKHPKPEKPVAAPAPIAQTHTAAPLAPPSQVFDAADAQPITSPNTSLSGLVGAIQNAQTSLDIEQMTFNSAWSSATPTSPLYDAVVAAARRGVKVRVLLNDESVFGDTSPPGGKSTKASKPINAPTAQKLNDLASSESLQIEARIANVKAMGVDYIHNKGMLIDGKQTLISSINWDENSVTNNREAAVLITSPTVNSYYGDLFAADWNDSASRAELSPAQVAPREVPAKAPPSFDCPSALSLKAKLGEIAGADKDYALLSDKSFTADFSPVPSDDRCLYSEDSRPAQITTTNRYVELRPLADGSVSLLLEGYTPKELKIYSIRAKITQSSGLTGLPATVYEGSGTHQRIGTATLSVSLVR